MLVSFFQLGVQVLPHVANDASDFGDAEVGVFDLDLIVDVHAIEEKRTEGLFWRIWRDIKQSGF